MKKLLALLIALSMLCCFASAEDTDVTGTWNLATIEMGTVTLEPSLLGMEMTLTLNADGTASLTATGEENLAGTWTQDGASVVVVINDESQTFTLSDDALRVTDDATGTPMTMVLTREKPSTTVYTPAPARADATLEELQGEWNGLFVDMMGIVLPVDMAGMQLLFTIAQDDATIFATFAGNEATSKVTIEAKDGAFEVTTHEEDVLPGTETVPMCLLEDGMMSIAIPYVESMNVTLYLARVTE